MKKIAILAEAYHVPIAPHCTATLLDIAASLHTTASVPIFLIHEFYPRNSGFNPAGFLKMDWKLDKEGYIGLPPGPGLGVEVNEKKLAELAPSRRPTNGPAAPTSTGRWQIIDGIAGKSGRALIPVSDKAGYRYLKVPNWGSNWFFYPDGTAGVKEKALEGWPWNGYSRNGCHVGMSKVTPAGFTHPSRPPTVSF